MARPWERNLPASPIQAPASGVTATTAAPIEPTANFPAGSTSEPAVPLAEKIIGAGIAVAPNFTSITNIDPWLTGFSGVINVSLDRLKNEKWFPESWTPLILIVLALAIAWGVYAVIGSEDAKIALGKGAWIATQAHANWIGGKRLGIFAPTSQENRFHGGK